MKFGPRPLQDCLHAYLGHAFHQGKLRISKGTVLDQDLIDKLAEFGLTELTVATLEADDIDENTAAHTIATALCGGGLIQNRPIAGRVQLRAQATGLVHVPEALIHKLNQLGWKVTIACPRDRKFVPQNTLVASIKIIPYAISQAELQQALDLIESTQLHLSPLQSHRVGLIVSQQGSHPPKWLDRAIMAQKTRLQALSCQMEQIEFCPHSEDGIATALKTLLDKDLSPILFLGASAIVDADDCFPKAIQALGGQVIHVGMPVDPGNLLLLAQKDERAIIGIPGCARSLKATGYDAVLQQVLCGLIPSALDIQAMGVGGLLEATRVPQPPQPSPTALIMLAGQSQRMGQENKLLLPTGPDRVPMARLVVQRLLAAGFEELVAVVGHDSAAVIEALSDLAVSFVENPNPEAGLSSSIRCGIEAIPEASAALIVLGDMPFVTVESYQKLKAAAESFPRRIIAPVFQGQRGNPVLFPKWAFERLSSLEGDQGAKELLKDFGFKPLPLHDSGILRDIDRPQDLKPAPLKSTLRQACPSLNQSVNGHPLIYFDHAATTPRPQPVLEAVSKAELELNANVGRSAHFIAGQATIALETARQSLARFIHADPKGLIFTSGTTEGLNGLAHSIRSGQDNLQRILLNEDDHHALLLPFQHLAAQNGGKASNIPLMLDGRIDLEALEYHLQREPTSLLVLSMASNVLGIVQPIKEIARLAHQYGARLIVDGAQVVAHQPIDLLDLDVDAFVFGAHKVFGPMGVGLLWVKPDWLRALTPWKLGGGAFLEWSGSEARWRDIPHSFEAGTPNLPGILGFEAAVSWLSEIGWTSIQSEEDALKAYLQQRLADFEGLRLLASRPDIPLFSFVLEGIHAHDVGTLLDEVGIAVRTGQHCASLLYQDRQIDAATRISLSFLNRIEECDILIDRLRTIQQLFHG